ncbi:hypothetical protein [Actinomadura sp. WMMB 499]|uniref:hypothetical protein n=1 Tax=Actinomadura sp. WMMB 499 TaxID=1219491 RepID=UPI00124773F4|nr:hypothetical protein [Actinomadura sp. WMMB 499]QFG24904.1 hypothetical protein F7P10_30985 [Actinomadura sp. WMMB 499]
MARAGGEADAARTDEAEDRRVTAPAPQGRPRCRAPGSLAAPLRAAARGHRSRSSAPHPRLAQGSGPGGGVARDHSVVDFVPRYR